MKGKVYLVGAGPGDYGLLTLKGLECIRKAEVIVYDRLINIDYLKEASTQCELIDVGKSAAHHTLPQEQINQLLAQKAKEGKFVTRLKGGDPYVFGRGGEEGGYLYEHHIPFEVVPGVTSAIAGLCYAGIPITHRDYASSFHVVTGHLRENGESIQWQALAQMGGTIVFLMGVSHLNEICIHLRAEGMKEDTLVAVINWGTTTRQKVVVGNLATIEEVAGKAMITSPSLIVVGEVVSLREKLNFFEKKPLFGKTIVTTRARSGGGDLANKLSTLGAKVIEFPTIRIVPTPMKDLEERLKGIRGYNYLIFTSQNTVGLFFEKLFDMGMDVRMLLGIQIVAIGQATARALKQYGIRADLIPEHYVAESIGELLVPKLKGGERILFPKGAKSRNLLEGMLNQVAQVETVTLYENHMESIEKEPLMAAINAQQVDYITFTSSSTVNHFLSLVGREHLSKINEAKLIAIGDTTAETMMENGLKVYGKPEQFTIDAMITYILKDSVVKEDGIDDRET